jgi:hypothetical protein
MLKTISVAALTVATLGFAGSAMAVPVNPWEPGQTVVPITITIAEMVELYTDTTNVPLTIADGGENGGSTRAVSRTLTHLHNVDVNVSAAIDGDIPNWTQFHILVNPAATWALPTASGASKTLSWRRDGGGYTGADGGFPNQVSGAGINAPLLAFSAAANNPSGDVEDIQYFADARNGMPAAATAPTFDVLWTIAKQ